MSPLFLVRVLLLSSAVAAWPSAAYSQNRAAGDAPGGGAAEVGTAPETAAGATVTDDSRDGGRSGLLPSRGTTPSLEGGGTTSGTKEVGGVGNEPPRAASGDGRDTGGRATQGAVAGTAADDSMDGGGRATPGAVAEDAYLRGYIDALLETRFAGLRLWVDRVTADGQISLTGETCLGISQRHEVEQRLADTGLVREVRWDPATDCDRQTERAAVPTPAPREVRALPERELFAPLVADPRQPRFSMSYQYYRTPSERFDAAAVALGEYFGLAEGFTRGRGSSQVGIEAAVFALFNLDAASKDLVNADYRIAVPLSYRRGPWSYQLSLLHQSSHLGDELLLGNPGLDRVNLSYEAVRFLASREWERWRLYGGGSYLLHSEPDLARNAVQGGVEYHRPHAWRHFDFVAGLDVKSSEELGWRTSYATTAGFEIRRAGVRRLRLMLEYFDGHSPNGQFFRERLNYAGLGLYFGF